MKSIIFVRTLKDISCNLRLIYTLKVGKRSMYYHKLGIRLLSIDLNYVLFRCEMSLSLDISLTESQ
jgi:hypothetical protein